MKTNLLSSSTVVITGASSGIGKAAALLFAKEGANVVLASRSETLLQELASQCEALGAQAIAVKTDVTDKNSVKNLFDTAMKFYGDVNIWINNAGVGAVGEFNLTPLEAHEQVIKTNLLGPLYGSYVVLPYFKKKGHGVIINTNSTGAYVGNPLTVSYSASKFGLRGMSEALKYELENYSDIHVCDLYAGFVDSPALDHAANFAGKEIKPIKPLVDPERMAEAMVQMAKFPHSSTHLGVMDHVGRFAHALFPKATGKIMNKISRKFLSRARKTDKTQGNLFSPNYDRTFIHGGFS